MSHVVSDHFRSKRAVRHPRIALPPFGGGVSGGVLSSASDEDGGGLQGAIRAERAWRARQSNTVPPMDGPDSNPCWSGFKPPASAIWATGACQATAGCDPSAHLLPRGAVMQRMRGTTDKTGRSWRLSSEGRDLSAVIAQQAGRPSESARRLHTGRRRGTAQLDPRLQG